jgi:hypothetical protein
LPLPPPPLLLLLLLPRRCRFEPFSAALNKYMRTLGLLG